MSDEEKFEAFESLILEMPDQGECFTFDDGEGGVTTFAVCLMNKVVELHLARCPLIKIVTQPILPDHVAHVRRKMGIEQDRIDRLVEPYISKPFLGVIFEKRPTGFSLIDGNHCLIKKHERGDTTYEVAIWHWKMWRQFELDGSVRKPDWKTRPSRMIETEQEELKNVG